ncbi:flagellum-specific ATP synthase [Buchnera aphidicola str. JF99 (Acyrthosiphon pisum)]|nr:flagellum-specific ATP synthase [Buchnera aphidicola str. TLW03 (Acyrthosiphon pisum)]ADP67051.1 flagellum-specific ATP synthase [Buchnera aphidicola str. JF99 (Acyrthosiphon pisum)]ADP67626.1 flagellum-specific ATP synthase [Buchnera aphidicola str. JF98 (Acyrthosiphon pisum)]
MSSYLFRGILMNLRFAQFLKNISSFESRIEKLSDIINYGRLVSINGLILEVVGLNTSIGSECLIERTIDGKNANINAEVIGFSGEKTFLLSFEDIHGIFPGARVFSKIASNSNFFIKKLPLGMELLGRVLDGRGQPLDQLPKIDHKYYSTIKNYSINPLNRTPITEVLDTGIRAINGLLTIGRGQKIGIFSSSGIGKSILLGMIARYTQADIIVIALIGERGREVKDFIENILGLAGLSRSVIIAAPADVSPLLKIKAASYATNIAEYFYKNNKHVLLIMDSLTRYAMAQREISLSLGELPVSKGYPSSIFSKIPNLIERTGIFNKNKGSITSFYTVLTEGEDEQDPVSHLARSVLDGHIMLSRYYADLGHYPAIDIESSISRVMPNIINAKQYSQAFYFKKLVASYQRNRDLINIGAYVSGTDVILDHAIKIWPKLEKFLQQEISEKSDYLFSCEALNKIFI